MKKAFFTLVALLLAGTAANAQSFDLKGFLSGVVEEVTATDKFQISDLEGEWKYTSPAVSFESNDALSNIGGKAANSTVEENLSKYYKRLGLNKVEVTFDAEGNFTAKLKKIQLSGVVTRAEDGKLCFEFKPIGSFSLGKVSAKATKNANGTLELTFDATKLVKAVQTISSYANNSTLNSISSIIDNYQGIYLGAKLKKQ